MSEEQIDEQVDEAPAVETAEEESGNPIFNALFKAVEEEQEEEDVREFTPPQSLHGALYELDANEEDLPEDSIEEHKEDVPQEPQATESKPSRVKRRKRIVDPKFEKPLVSPTEPSPQEYDDLTGLNADERKRYELAKWASENLEGYKNKHKSYLSFFRKHQEFLNKKLSEDPDADLSQDSEYRSFLVQNQPAFNAEEVKEKKITTEAEKKALSRLQPEHQRLERQIKALRNEPIAKELKAKKKKLVSDHIPKDVMDLFRSNPNFSKTHALEAKIVDRVLGDAYSMIEAFYDIAHELTDYDENNPIHVKLSKWIDNEQTNFINSGKTKRGGRLFVRRERFPSVPEAERSKYYTFSDDDVMKLLAARAGQSVDTQIKNTLKNLQESGFTRGGQQSLNPPPIPQAAPATRRSPSPRPGPSAPQAEPKSDNTVLSLLGL
jgi:hypothetical protein